MGKKLENEDKYQVICVVFISFQLESERIHML